MAKLHIKKNDTVIVLAGEDKGKTGKVLKVFVETFCSSSVAPVIVTVS